MQSTGQRVRPPRSERSPLVRQASMPIGSGVAVLAGYHRSPPRSSASKSDPDRTIVRSDEACHLCATVPTSVPFGSRCSRSAVFASFAAPLRLAKPLVCCIDRLNPHPISAAGGEGASSNGKRDYEAAAKRHPIQFSL
ncbi:protein of unknown function (plasmid) [Cupriavidus taiwanensis]|uniref:Uncharacterized protein n=1 Tax=Cupriavidus taiwanensis TaxID=164546 RepID=A0A375ITV9_9BURK|nr:protein of unknown function [Cupriavidus taiwanensis]